MPFVHPFSLALVMTSLARLSRTILVLPFAAVTLACGSDGATAPEATLTKAQFEELMEAVPSFIPGDYLIDILGFSMSPAMRVVAAGGDQTAPSAAVTIDEERFECSRVRGQVGLTSIDLRVSFSDCKSNAWSTQREFTFNSDPDIRTVVSESNGTLSMSVSGAFRFTSEGVMSSTSGPSGRCSVSLQYRPTSRTLYGTICGKYVEDELYL